MAVYDDQKLDTRQDDKEAEAVNSTSGISDDDLREMTGIGVDEEAGMEDGAYSGAAEDMAEREGLDDVKYREESGGGRFSGLRNFRLTKAQGAGGLIAGLLIGGGLGAGSILQGPMQLISFSKMLDGFHNSNNDNFADGRTGRHLYHRIKSGSGNAKMNTRLGVVGNRVADKMEIRLQKRSGLRSLYDASTGLHIGYEVIDEKLVSNSLISADVSPDLDMEFTGMESNVVGSDGIAANGENRMLAFKNTADGRRMSIKARRDFSQKLTKTLGLNKVASSVAFRQTAKRGGLDLHPIKRAERRLNESATDFARRQKESWKEKIKNGTSPVDENSLVRTNEDGTQSQESVDADTQGKEAKADARSGDKVGAKSRTAAKIAGGAVFGIGVLCTARSISDNVDNAKYANIVLPLMRMGTQNISRGNQVMSGEDIDMETLGVISQTLYTEETGSWASAKSIQAELGQPQLGKDIEPTARPSAVGDKPEILKMIDSIFNKIAGVGDAACSTIGQFALGAITGGIISQVVGEVVSRAASSLGVNPLDKFSEWIVDTLAGDMINPLATGADLGNNSNYGVRLAANEQAISMGGSKLSRSQVAVLDADSKTGMMEEFQSKSLMARVFDPKEPKSLVASTLVMNNFSATSNFSSTITSIFGTGGLIGKQFISLVSPSAYAQDEPYDYGFDEFGFSREDQNSELYDDPYENAMYVEQNLQNLTDKYGNCFSTKVSSTGSLEENKVNNEALRYDQIEPRCNGEGLSEAEKVELNRYRFYIADTTLAKSMDCYEGNNESCAEIGFGSGSPTPQLTAAPTGPVSEDQDTSGMQCPAGTADAGIQQDYGPGKVETVKLRLCNVKGVANVNASIAQNALNMITAAEQAGHTLTGSSWRSYDSQASLRSRNGCPDADISPSSSCSVPTARAGSGKHEVGLAIDFDNMCFPKAVCPSSPAWVWLTENAAQYNFKKLNSEAWHWSPDGT